jgi:hypothetical protein
MLSDSPTLSWPKVRVERTSKTKIAFIQPYRPYLLRFMPVVQSVFSYPLLIGYGIDHYPMTQIRLHACFVMFCLTPPLPVSAWNILAHMLSAIITYQVLNQENPETIEKVQAALEKHPWYANQWRARLQEVPVADHGLVLFMQPSRWADDIRTQDRQITEDGGTIFT